MLESVVENILQNLSLLLCHLRTFSSRFKGYLSDMDARILGKKMLQQFISRVRRKPLPARIILGVIKDARENCMPVVQLANKLRNMDSRLEVKVLCTGFLHHGLKAYQVEVNEKKGSVRLHTGEPQGQQPEVA